MSLSKTETGVQFLARLGSRPSLIHLEPAFFGEGPKGKEVIELCGAEGTAKSETMHHFIVRCILPKSWKSVELYGCDAHVIFIDTDYKFSILRLASLLERYILNAIGKARQNSCETDLQYPGSEETENFIKECLKKLYIIRCTSSTQLIITLHSLESFICSNPNISVIMIDSISAFYWVDRCNGGESFAMQEVNMRLACEELSKLVNTYNITVFATKQELLKKKTDFERGDREKSTVVQKLDFEHQEYMCKAWQKMVTGRLVYRHVDIPDSGKRKFVVLAGPVSEIVTFFINDDEIQFLSNN
ncbi:hypothetical protein CHS0354_009237 [Potamilus streckersoni]|uniref:RecA family profile 1 domain-containing protein n=1 Tax=Potamilus streckersoni TaxID=2493646 RepID=A0AAE0SJZ9_9BIVA|nr:hypothetical protein CHS0354_009237 [Potamilus streckersoni]